MNTRTKLGALALGIVVLGFAGWQHWAARNTAPTGASGAGGATGAGGWSMIRPGGEDAAPGPLAVAGQLTPDQVRDRLFRHGSFAGTEPSGNWCITEGKLKACPGLRQRFEYYILGLGEVRIEDLRALVADEATQANGPELAEQIMAVWDRYWQLRQYNYRNQFVQNDRNTWMPVFEEQKAVRRQILGADWAQAFYGDDEQAFLAHVSQLASGAPPPPDPGEPVPQMAPGKDPAAVQAERVARYGQAAADRLAQADAEWADWQQRLTDARAEWARLQGAGNLSDPQRKQEMDSYIQAHFKPDEVLRVRALLHL